MNYLHTYTGLILSKKHKIFIGELEPHQRSQIVHLEKSQSFLDVGVGDERLECHLGEALGDPHHRLQLPHSDGDGQPLLTLLLHLEEEASRNVSKIILKATSRLEFLIST